ncbi:MAG: flagellar basal body P-ring formation chaperone FlgA [Acidobacteriales bacterium]|nr:flagellar basal body P-ring formation chaperone FlgA [Terriglobales bacterium]
MKRFLMLVSLPMIAGDCLPVAGDRVTVADLARALPAFAAAPATDVLGYAPEPGFHRSFSATDLQRWARRYGLNESRFTAGACVERTAAPLTEAAVLEALRLAIAMPGARVELIEFSRRPVPGGKLEFPRSGLVASPRWRSGEPVVWKGRMKYGSGRSFPVWARAVVGITGRHVVARRALPVGQVITADQVTVEDYERLPFAPPEPAEIEEVVGSIPRRSIEAGKAVSAAVLGQPRVVEKGDRVAVEVRTGSMKLTMDAVSETGGRSGETVVLRNPSSGKRFRARIEGKGRAVSVSPTA